MCHKKDESNYLTTKVPVIDWKRSICKTWIFDVYFLYQIC